MGSGPKQSEFQESEANIQQTRVAKADWDKFQNLYNPALLGLKKQAESDDTATMLRGRGNANAMQALTKNLSYSDVTNEDAAGMGANALGSTLGDATAKGLKARNDLSAGVLATRNKQAGVGNQGLSALANMETNNTLKDAENNRLVKGARTQALLKIGTSAVMKAGEEGMFGSGGGEDGFFSKMSTSLKAQGGG